MSDSGKLPGWVLWVTGLVLVGLVFRLLMFGQSAFGDEMSTLWIVRGNDLPGVWSAVNSDAEISPPLYFLLAKASSWIFGQTPTGVRMPSLVAGILVIPVFWFAAVRAIGRRGAIYAVAVAAWSPFLIYLSANARAYSVMILMLVMATVFLLRAGEDGSRWWDWAGWAVAGALAVYSHYTAGLVVFAQFVWALWFLPSMRRQVLLSVVAMAVMFAPWLGGFLADLNSPTSEILEALQGSGLGAKVEAVTQFFFLRVGLETNQLLDRPEVLLGIAALLVALGGLAWRWRRGQLGSSGGPRRRGIALVVLMAGSVFAGELLLLALGTDIFGTRNLAAAWAALPLLIGALLVAAGPRAGVLALVLLMAGYGVNNLHLVDAGQSTIPFAKAADWIESQDDPNAVILDGSILDPAPLSPAPLTPLDGYLSTDLPEFRLTNIEDRPDFIERMYLPFDAQPVVDQAFAGSGPVYLLLTGQTVRKNPDGGYSFRAGLQPVEVPSGWEPSGQVEFSGLSNIYITTFTRKEPRHE